MIIWLLFIHVLHQPTALGSKHRKNLVFNGKYAYWLNLCTYLKNGKRKKWQDCLKEAEENAETLQIDEL